MFHTELEATNICNTRCLHCPHESITRPTGRMDWETYSTIISKIREHVKGERFSVSYSGMGEPFLNPLLCRFIRHISDEAVTSFASNGAALTEETVSNLLEAGLDMIYLSFNGDEPWLFSKMMGGLSFDRVLSNLRKAVALCEGKRLKLRANVSITKANQHRVDAIKGMLEREGLASVSLSLCHDRGGNLKDQATCDTPPMGAKHWECDVMKNTLFIDWQGRAHICDHDLHGEYLLGDLMREPLAAVLERRQALLRDSSGLAICRECNDIMRIGGTFPLESRAGGNFRDWIYYLYRDLEDPLSEANEPMRWIFRIFHKENRTDRFANRLLAIEKEARVELERLRIQNEILVGQRGALTRELEETTAVICRERDSFDADRAEFERDLSVREAERRHLQATLDERDGQFAELHASFCQIRRDWAWRLISMLRRDVARIRMAMRLRG